jgi:hypothetical protein
LGCGSRPKDFAAALEALGLLKLDTPDSVHKEGVEFIATMARSTVGSARPKDC